VQAGQFLGFGPAPGTILAGLERVRSDGDLYCSSANATIGVFGQTGAIVQAMAGGASLQGSTTVGVTAPAVSILGSASIVLRSNSGNGQISLDGFPRVSDVATVSVLNVGFRKRVVFAASGASGTLVDIPIWAAGAGNVTPFVVRLISAMLRVSTAFLTGTGELRTALAGGGVLVLADATTPTQTFSVATVGKKTDNATADVQLAQGTQLYLRVDRSVGGTIVLECERS
jgi:hypothetical protein